MTISVEVREGAPATSVVISCPLADATTDRIAAFVQGLDATLTGTKDGRTHLIAPSDVLYVESVDKRCFLYTAGAAYATSLHLYELEDLLGPAGFIRCSKSTLVNLMRIKALRPEFGARLELTLASGDRLIVSRAFARPLKERLGLL